MLRTRPLAVLTALIVGLALAACGGDTVNNDPTSTPNPTTAATSTGSAAATATAGQGSSTVSVDLKEFTVAPTTSSVKTGQISFRVTNTGTIEHELQVIRTELAPDALPLNSDGSQVDTSKLDQRLDLTQIDAGKSKTEQISIAPGKYVLICNTPGHYQGGMRTAFTVTP